MKYNEDYIYSKDIDWFFVANGKYVHVASAGGMIPDIINDREKLRDIQREVFLAPDIYTDEQIIINEDFIIQRFGISENLNQSEKSDQSENFEQCRELYLRSFMAMARKGFISLDRTNFYDPDDNTYHIVCMPPNDETIGIQGITQLNLVDAGFLEEIKNNIKLLDNLSNVTKE